MIKIKPQNAFLREIWGSFLLKHYFYALSAHKFKPVNFPFNCLVWSIYDAESLLTLPPIILAETAHHTAETIPMSKGVDSIADDE